MMKSMEPITVSNHIEAVGRAPHEIYYFEVTLEERMAVARDPKKFLHTKGVSFKNSQRVSLHNHYELPPTGTDAAGYLIVVSTPENLIIACVNCDSTDPEFSDHRPTGT